MEQKQKLVTRLDLRPVPWGWAITPKGNLMFLNQKDCDYIRGEQDKGAQYPIVTCGRCKSRIATFKGSGEFICVYCKKEGEDNEK